MLNNEKIVGSIVFVRRVLILLMSRALCIMSPTNLVSKNNIGSAVNFLINDDVKEKLITEKILMIVQDLKILATQVPKKTNK